MHRLELLRPILDRYKRRFTVLDLGAGIDLNVALPLSRDYVCVVVAVEQNFDRFALCEGLSRFCVLKKHFNVNDLNTLAECEHFDVVLALNFVHHFEEQSPEAARAVLQLGDHVFVQIPKDEDQGVPAQAFMPSIRKVLERQCTVIGETVQYPKHMPRRMYYTFTGPRTLVRTGFTAQMDSAYTIIKSDYNECTADLRHKGPKQWIPGINLANFCQLGGVWPPRDKVVELVRTLKLPETNHGDLVPWNMVFDGEQIYIVDGYEGWMFPDAENLKASVRWVEEHLC